MNTYDVCIVGAGVVGCVIARELMGRCRPAPIRLLVLEQHARPGEETSGRNSGVLHSGIHEAPFSLKARLAHEGCRSAAAYALERGIPLLRTGMLIVVSKEDIRRGLWREVAMLRRLWVNAWRTNTRVRFMTPSAVREWEPQVRASCGLAIPDVSVIDSQAFVQSLRTDAEVAGVEFAFGNRVVGIEATGGSYLVSTDRQQIRAACLINAAGLYADEIASLALHHHKYTIRPLRGEYYEVMTSEKTGLIGRPVYPALPPGATGKGIHLSPRPDGRLYVGPNEVPVQDKADYTSHKTPPGLFVDAVQKFCPALDERDLSWAYSGIRPRVETTSRSKRDFIVSVDRDDPLLVDLIGIESPGLSAAMALARHVCDLPSLQKRFPSG
ncbi:MAG: NAD(P)/FAD-dependent oxidoreductase [Nitrospira sp.]|nr:NAD(P)/FAD-dependent oxidoreductase [Nitrospira sp.]